MKLLRFLCERLKSLHIRKLKLNINFGIHFNLAITFLSREGMMYYCIGFKNNIMPDFSGWRVLLTADYHLSKEMGKNKYCWQSYWPEGYNNNNTLPQCNTINCC